MYARTSSMEEIFMILDDFPAYRISNLGKIQSRWKRGSYYNGFTCVDVWKDLPMYPDRKGYLQVHLCDGYGQVKTVRIHNMVTRCFLGERPVEKPVVRHLDSNPSNNKLTNLTYGTYVENENDKIKNGTWNSRFGGAKLTPIQVKEIRYKLKCNISQKDLAIEYDVSRPTITRISNNKIWK